MMQKLLDISEILTHDELVKHIIPLIEGCLTDKKWRFKFSVAQSLIGFFKNLAFEEHRQFYDKVLGVFLKDHNFAVR